MKRALVGLLVVWFGVGAFAQVTEVHDPWLNWDFYNYTGTTTNDFHIVVDTPNWTPPEVYTSPTDFPVFGTAQANGGTDTELIWSGAEIAHGGVAHVGAYMLGSGPVLDAYWTSGGTPVPWLIPGLSTPIVPLPGTYELTFVEIPQPGADGAITMQLNLTESFFDALLAENPGAQAGWRNIRGWRDIPASILDLEDLNESSLPYGDIEDYEITGDGLGNGELRADGPSGEIIDGDETYLYGGYVESFFDVYFDVTPNTGPEYESLLYAELVVDVDGTGDQFGPEPVGQFWNLNPQSPEPGTALFLAFAALGIYARRRRRA